MIRLLLSISFFSLALTPIGGVIDCAQAAEELSSPTKKVIKYRQSSEVDLSGATVQGKLRNPTVFYILQRNRSKSPTLLSIPKNLDHHHEISITTLKRYFDP